MSKTAENLILLGVLIDLGILLLLAVDVYLSYENVKSRLA